MGPPKMGHDSNNLILSHGHFIPRMNEYKNPNFLILVINIILDRFQYHSGRPLFIAMRAANEQEFTGGQFDLARPILETIIKF